MSGVVHFKFRSALTYDNVSFDGHYVSVGEIKKLIADKKGLGVDGGAELELSDPQTKQVYKDDSVQLPRNSSVVVKRIPAAKGRHAATTGRGGPTAAHNSASASYVGLTTVPATVHANTAAPGAIAPSAQDADDFGDDVYEEQAAKRKAALDDEQARIEAALHGQEEQWHSEQDRTVREAAARGRGRGGRGYGRGGRPPDHYWCRKCGAQGQHWQHDCPKRNEPDLDLKFVRAPAGIPMTMLNMTSEGGLLLPNGELASMASNDELFRKEMAALPSAAAKKRAPQPAPALADKPYSEQPSQQHSQQQQQEQQIQQQQQPAGGASDRADATGNDLAIVAVDAAEASLFDDDEAGTVDTAQGLKLSLGMEPAPAPLQQDRPHSRQAQSSFRQPGDMAAGGPPPPEPPPKDELKHFLPFMMDMMPIAPTPTLLRMFKGPIPLTYDEFLSVQDEVRSGTSKMVSHSHHSADSRRKRSRSRERSGHWSPSERARHTSPSRERSKRSMSRDRSRRSPSRDVSRRYADDHGAAAPAASSQRPRSSAGRPASRTPGRESPSHYSDLRHMLEQRRKDDRPRHHSSSKERHDSRRPHSRSDVNDSSHQRHRSSRSPGGDRWELLEQASPFRAAGSRRAEEEHDDDGDDRVGVDAESSDAAGNRLKDRYTDECLAAQTKKQDRSQLHDRPSILNASADLQNLLDDEEERLPSASRRNTAVAAGAKQQHAGRSQQTPIGSQQQRAQPPSSKQPPAVGSDVPEGSGSEDDRDVILPSAQQSAFSHSRSPSPAGSGEDDHGEQQDRGADSAGDASLDDRDHSAGPSPRSPSSSAAADGSQETEPDDGGSKPPATVATGTGGGSSNSPPLADDDAQATANGGEGDVDDIEALIHEDDELLDYEDDIEEQLQDSREAGTQGASTPAAGAAGSGSGGEAADEPGAEPSGGAASDGKQAKHHKKQKKEKKEKHKHKHKKHKQKGAEADVSEEDKGHGRHSRQRSVSPDRDRHAGGRHDRIVWQEPGQRHTSNRATEQVSHQRTGSDRPSSTQWAANSAADDEQQPRAGSRATAEHSSRDRAEGGKRLGMFQRALQGVLVPRPDDRDKLWKATSRSGGEEGPSKRRGEEEGRLWSSHNSNRENKRSRRDTRD